MKKSAAVEGSTSGSIFFASAISNLLNPLIVGFFLFYTLVSLQPEVWGGEGSRAILLAMVFYCLIPFLVLLTFRLLNRIETLEVRNRHNRHVPFLFGILSYSGGYLWLVWQFGVAGLVQAAAFSLLLSAVVAALITLKWKISVHTTAITMAGVLVMYAVFGNMPLGWFISGTTLFILASAAVMWSRIVLKAHTTRQAAAGILFGLFFGLTILVTYPL